MESTVKERLKEYIKNSGITVQSFEKRIGAKNSYVNSISKSIGANFLKAIEREFPNLNTDWLLTGQGEMLKKAQGDAPQIYGGFRVRLLPTEAMGGSLINIDSDGITEDMCRWIGSPVKGSELAIPVMGDSMAPDYPSGSIVFVKRINHAAFINWGQVYVLDTENGIIVKEVQPSDSDEFITCVSLNPSQKYKPFDVPKSSIRAMYRVIASTTLR